MPELPDITVYVERLSALTVGRPLEKVRLVSPFLLRTVDPPLKAVEGHAVTAVSRFGKRIVLTVGDEPLYLVIHLMIAGRVRWKKKGTAVPKRNGLAAFDFAEGTAIFTEASKKKRASLHVVRADGLDAHRRAGYEVLEGDVAGFKAALTRENRTLKRALTDPRILSGIGNAYSDEILFAARLSPVKLTSRLSDDEIDRLYTATVGTLTDWTARFRAEVGDGFPDKVTAFRPEMAVHGKYREPCPVCAQPIQRIRYADNETNYCARCQNADRLLADRGLSRLLKKDWPRTLDELEALRDS